MKRPRHVTSRRYNGKFPRLVSLRLRSKVDRPSTDLIQQVCADLPALHGESISVFFRPHLKAYRGKLLSGAAEPGTPVHAASFIRKRNIYLETQLLANPEKLRLILTHEVFHFVWARLGNALRREYGALVKREMESRARGELGESAGYWKGGKTAIYICESFCDTAAYLYAGVKSSADFKLAARWTKQRAEWFKASFGTGRVRCC